ncbi:MAG: hypothetical protein ABWY05_00590 [Noviherbaspirillum sp.]
MTVTYLGVRRWSTYFFEKLIATPNQIAKAKVKTQVAIEQNVRSFLNNGGLTLGRSAEAITAALQSNVVGKSVTPTPVPMTAANQEGKVTTRPAYRTTSEVVETKCKIFHGAATVPTGLSIAASAPLRFIANVRLVTEATYKTHPQGDSSKGLTVSQGDFVIDKRNSVPDYKTQYLARLNFVAGLIATSVVLEVQRDAEGKCSEANQEGARSAAKEFAERQALQGKHVSVMLTVPKLPSVAQPESATVKVVDTAPKLTPNNILVADDSSEMSDGPYV